MEYRRLIKVELIEMGYKRVVIMEDVLTEFGDITLDDKFRRIVKVYDPALFIAFFHKRARMDEVTFEIGWLCSYYHPGELEKRLLIFNEENFDWNKTTSYIPAFFPNIGSISFNERNRGTKSSVLINKRVLHMILRR